jgi:biotin synthase
VTNSDTVSGRRIDKAQVREWFELPFFELLHRAHDTHRRHFPGQRIQRSALLSIKTGGCSEDCGYCAQSARHHAHAREPLLDTQTIVRHAAQAKAAGATRFCMGAAWRAPKDKDLERVAEAVAAVKSLGLETCVTLGMLSPPQATRLKEAGLDYYNHNVDTSPEHYGKVITTHTLSDRLRTLEAVREAGIKVCCGGILGMGETREDRISMLALLAGLDPQPESVPINQLIPIPGTPLADAPPVDPFELVRTIAVARLALPRSYVRLSAGRSQMSDELQALCFYAGANSLFYGEKLLTAGNPDVAHDDELLARLDLQPE